MSTNIYQKMVYSFQQPMWHAITEPSVVPLGAEEILDQRFGGGFSVDVRPLTITLNGESVQYGGYGIVRASYPLDPQEIVFGTCTERYHPLQPRDVCRTFDEKVGQNAETMAFLGEGNDMFISWQMPSFEVVPGDEVNLYGIVRTGFDTLKGTRLFTSIVRPVCWNTITMAEGWAKRNTDRAAGKGELWKGKGVNKNLLRDLGYWMAHVQGKAKAEAELLRSFFGKLATTPIKSDVEAHKILWEAFPSRDDISSDWPVELREDKAESIRDYNERQEYMRDGIYHLFAGAGTAITPDYWGMLNATTEFVDHYWPSKRPIAESVMFGPRAKVSMQMVNTLANHVNS
jgi:hypothetical protein